MSKKNAVGEYIRNAIAGLSEMDTVEVDSITRAMYLCLLQGGKILICGNGGSASDASHFAGELVGRFRRDRSAMAAVSLTVDPAVITAVANDYGYEQIFSRQVEALGRPGDVLVAITTSGKSPNVIRAAEKASEIGLTVIAFTSASCVTPGWAHLHWKSGCSKTSHTQEQMLVAFHAVCHGLEELFAESK